MTLDEFERRQRDWCIPRVAFGKHNASPFEYLYNNLNDQALLNTPGVIIVRLPYYLENSNLTTTTTHITPTMELFVEKYAIKMVSPRVGREIGQPLDVLTWYLYGIVLLTYVQKF